MTVHTLKPNAATTAPFTADSRSRAESRSRRAYSAVIGALFVSAFFLYGLGYGLVTSITGAADFVATISTHQTVLTIGAFLMLLNSAAVVGLGVLFFPIVARHGQRTALAYLAARLVEGIFLAVGVVCLLLTVPMGQFAGEAWAVGLGSLATQANTLAYQIAMMSLGFASLFLCALLFRTRLIPRVLAVAGLIGYAIFMTGAVAEIFGVHIGLICSLPGGLFELAVGIWLMVKGFQPEAYGQAA